MAPRSGKARGLLPATPLRLVLLSKVLLSKVNFTILRTIMVLRSIRIIVGYTGPPLVLCTIAIGAGFGHTPYFRQGPTSDSYSKFGIDLSSGGA